MLDESNLQLFPKIRKVHQPKVVADSPSSPSAATITKTLSLKSLEEQTINQALEQANHNKTRAASLLGISLSALRYRLNKLKKQVTPAESLSLNSDDENHADDENHHHRNDC